LAIQIYPLPSDLSIPEPPKEYDLNSEMEEEDMEKKGPHEEESTDPDFQVPAPESPHKIK
jgi:hypothetical protein